MPTSFSFAIHPDPWDNQGVNTLEIERQRVVLRFRCPNCRQLCSHTTPGEKVLCPRCGQKLRVPQPPVPPPENKTVLGTWEPGPSAPVAPATATPPPAPVSPIVEGVPVLPASARPSDPAVGSS